MVPKVNAATGLYAEINVREYIIAYDTSTGATRTLLVLLWAIDDNVYVSLATSNLARLTWTTDGTVSACNMKSSKTYL